MPSEGFRSHKVEAWSPETTSRRSLKRCGASIAALVYVLWAFLDWEVQLGSA